MHRIRIITALSFGLAAVPLVARADQSVEVKSGGKTVTVKSSEGESGTGEVKEGEAFKVSGVGQKLTHTCTAERGTVLISGTNNTLTLAGPCTSIKLSGVGNHVMIESVKELLLSGTNNKVTATLLGALRLSGTGNDVGYKKALTGSKPEIKESGLNNKVVAL